MPVLFTKLLQSARKQHKKRSVNRITYIDTCRYVKQVYCRYNSKSWQDKYLFHLITHEKNFLFISALIWFAAEWMLVSCCVSDVADLSIRSTVCEMNSTYDFRQQRIFAAILQFLITIKGLMGRHYKMLSYRRETALQGALYFSPKVEH